MRYSFSEARKDFSTVYDRVENGAMAVIARRGSPPVAVVDVHEQMELLRAQFPFDVQVRVTKDNVAMWVDQLPVHAQADDIDGAVHALARELLEYAQEWEDELRHAPNHKGAWGYVRRIGLAGDEDAVADLLINETP